VNGGDRGEYVGSPSGSNEGIGSWSPDGRTVLSQVYRNGNWDVDIIDLTDGKRTPFLNTRFNEAHARISPDGKWVTYSSDENGRSDVYVSGFPNGSGKWQVSLSGGLVPRWSPDGKEIFFGGEDGRYWVVPVSTSPSFQSGEPKSLFPVHVPLTGYPQERILSARDGKRLLANFQTGEETPTPITVIVNWLGGQQK